MNPLSYLFTRGWWCVAIYGYKIKIIFRTEWRERDCTRNGAGWRLARTAARARHGCRYCFCQQVLSCCAICCNCARASNQEEHDHIPPNVVLYSERPHDSWASIKQRDISQRDTVEPRRPADCLSPACGNVFEKVFVVLPTNCYISILIDNNPVTIW